MKNPLLLYTSSFVMLLILIFAGIYLYDKTPGLGSPVTNNGKPQPQSSGDIYREMRWYMTSNILNDSLKQDTNPDSLKIYMVLEEFIKDHCGITISATMNGESAICNDTGLSVLKINDLPVKALGAQFVNNAYPLFFRAVKMDSFPLVKKTDEKFYYLLTNQGKYILKQPTTTDARYDSGFYTIDTTGSALYLDIIKAVKNGQ